MHSRTVIFILIPLLLAACRPVASQETQINPTDPASPTSTVGSPNPTDPPQPAPTQGLPNPASVNCQEKGNKLEIRTAADGSQSGVCVFPDGSQCDEWAYFRGECAPAAPTGAAPTPTSEAAPAPTAMPTPFPIDPSGYQGWWTYTHAVYNFSIMLPEDWIVDETTTHDPLMNGHMLSLHPKDQVANQTIRMAFRRLGEEVLLWPTGVGQGEFVPQGTLQVDGGPAQRVLLVCPGGDVTAIYYHQGEGVPNITRGDLEFAFIFSGPGHCEPGFSLGVKVQRVGEMIIASLKTGS